MMTFEITALDCPSTCDDGAIRAAVTVAPTPLPILGASMGSAAVGVALAFADAEAEATGEDRFALLLVDAEGEVLMRLGPFTEEDVVAQCARTAASCRSRSRSAASPWAAAASAAATAR
jgi:hypothetical protein